AMNGRVEAVNKPEGGAEFIVGLPLPFQKATTSPKPKNAKPPFVSDLNILVVEDDGWNARLIKELLSGMARRVKVCATAEEAIEFLQGNHRDVDLIMTDLRLPGMDGFSFLKEVRSKNTAIPMVALSAQVVEQDKQKILSKGFDKICTKPYEVQDIEEILAFYSGKKIIRDTEKQPEAKNFIRDGINLDVVRQFSGNNAVAMRNLFSDLVNQNQMQQKQFQELVGREDWSQLAELCHQM